MECTGSVGLSGHLGQNRAVRYHLKFAYHNTIVRVSRYTLGIDTFNVHMINDLHKIARAPFYVKIFY